MNNRFVLIGRLYWNDWPRSRSAPVMQWSKSTFDICKFQLLIKSFPWIVCGVRWAELTRLVFCADDFTWTGTWTSVTLTDKVNSIQFCFDYIHFTIHTSHMSFGIRLRRVMRNWMTANNNETSRLLGATTTLYSTVIETFLLVIQGIQLQRS